ncbi:nonribosomal peptide synthetase [Fusarium pseudoanthophilum]|uniref:Nonribosomal peptide synthetase n=1 Tax=Fusarium pseudoanthophilum TaxID=48495 RepID=A0A8H5PCY9_9HYPO|nr:nonribosomal peptide synthetase [Fusarium pseudoanthophilum]
MIAPGDVPTRETLICGCEQLGDLAPRIWSEKLKFIRAFGLTETCIYASISDRNIERAWDPVWHNLDGSIDAVQRKDTQIKIRGQRVEAGEI